MAAHRKFHMAQSIPCSVGTYVAGIDKYYNFTVAQDTVPETMRDRYDSLAYHALECIRCRKYEKNCPFGIANYRRAVRTLKLTKMPVKRNKIYRMIWIILAVLSIVAIAVIVFINQPDFGRMPRGERMGKIKLSPNYRDGQFQNLHTTPMLTSDKGRIRNFLDFLLRKEKGLRPEKELPVVKTDLQQLKRDQDLLIWFGHSSYLIQTDGKRILVDPVFRMAAPLSFLNKPFKGTDVYKPEDMPEIDYLMISHDHWDHLDYQTVLALKDRIAKVICPLGVGEHFEYWGFEKDRIIELDWNENVITDDGFTVYCLPTRHFSGRGLSPNQTLWASYLVQTPSQKIYIGGDGGYDTHFARIGQQFPGIDLAILENGQYDRNWKYIHLMPQYLVQAAQDLKAKRLLTVHHSKYALAKRPWEEPLNNALKAAENDSLKVILPMIGEPINLKDTTQIVNKWWEQ